MTGEVSLASLVEAVRLATGCLFSTRPIVIQSRGSGSLKRTIELDHPGTLKAAGALRGAQFDPAIYVNMTEDFGGRCDVVGFAYDLLDRQGRELLAFHWHPDPGVPAPSYPHLHVSAQLTVANASGEPDLIPLDKLHLPTSYVSLPAVVRMLIAEFGVRPLTPRWQERLGDAEQVLDRRSTGA